MAAKRKQTARADSSVDLWLACFELDEPGDPPVRATFQLVVHANGPEQAMDRCANQLRELRASTTLFRRPSTVYFNHVIRLGGDLSQPLLVNYTAAEIPERHVEVLAAIPEQKDRPGVEAFGPPEEEGSEMEAFLDFGGEATRKTLPLAQAAKRATKKPARAKKTAKAKRSR